MTHSIKYWRPRTWQDFIGQKNQREIERLKARRLGRRKLPPSLIVAPYGCGKTSLAEFLMASYCCPNAVTNPAASGVTVTGEPCWTCSSCLSQEPEYNGDAGEMIHYHIDCTKLSRTTAISQMESCQADDNVACYWDEVQRLTEMNIADLFLKPVERFKGIMLLSITPEHIKKFSPPLFERLHKIWLHPPTESELAAFLLKKAPEWQIFTSVDAIVCLVRKAQCSFRTCLDVMQEAFDTNSGVLDISFIREVLGDGPPDPEFSMPI